VFRVLFWALVVVTMLLGALILWIRLSRRTVQRAIADQAPRNTLVSLLLTAVTISFFAGHRYGDGIGLALFDAAFIALAVYGWWLRHKVEDKWQPWY